MFNKKFLSSLLAVLGISPAFSQLPQPSLIGYLHNWNAAEAPYIDPDKVDDRYNVVVVAFALPTSTVDMTMTFAPDATTKSNFISQIQKLQLKGKKVLISVGGATASIDLSTLANKNAFITSLNSIIDDYGFDGLDIDIESGNSVYILNGATVSDPSKHAAMQNLIDAVKSIMATYHSKNNKKLLLTMAPETAFVQGGQSGFGNVWGGYLPIINALKDSIDAICVQLYNSGTMYGLDKEIYTQGTADFIVAMTEACIRGFNTTGGAYNGLPASKVAVGLPACTKAAGGGYTNVDTIKAAVNYLLGKGPKPGNYTLQQSGGYPNLLGMMTWSINWDAQSNCESSYSYAKTYKDIFETPSTGISELQFGPLSVYPNPANTNLTIGSMPGVGPQSFEIYNSTGRVMINGEIENQLVIEVSSWPKGFYYIKTTTDLRKIAIY